MEYKYKVGDKVRVREDLKVDGDYYMEDGETRDRFVVDMAKFIGKVVTIKEHYHEKYRIEEDEDEYNWTDDMFSGLYSSKKEKRLNRKRMIEKMEFINVNEDINMGIFVEKIIHNEPATIMFYKVPTFDSSGNVKKYSNTRKVVAKCNTSIGDVYDKKKGQKVCLLKAFRKEIDRQLKKF